METTEKREPEEEKTIEKIRAFKSGVHQMNEPWWILRDPSA